MMTRLHYTNNATNIGSRPYAKKKNKYASIYNNKWHSRNKPLEMYRRFGGVDRKTNCRTVAFTIQRN